MTPAAATQAPPPAGPGRASARRPRWRFRLLHKLALIAFLANLPVLVLGYLFVAEGRKDIAQAARERAGAAYLVATWPVFEAAVRGEPAGTAAVVGLDRAAAAYDPLFGTAESRRRLETAIAEGSGAAINAGRRLLRRIADNSGLAVDPDLNVLQAVGVVATSIPSAATAAAEVAARITAGETVLGVDGAMERYRIADRTLGADLGATDALNFDSTITARLTEAQIAVADAAARFTRAASELSPLPGPLAFAEVAASHAAVQDAYAALWREATGAIDALLAARIDRQSRALVQEVGAAILLLIVVSLMVVALTRSITGRLAGLGGVMTAMKDGDYAVAIPRADASDEIGAMARAVEVFRDGLIAKRAADDLLRQQHETLARHRMALEEQNIRFDAALNNMVQGLAMFDGAARLTVANARFAELYQLPAELLKPGTPQADIVGGMMPLIASGAGPETRTRFEGRDLSQDFFVELADGRTVFVARRTMKDGGWVSTHEDVTERRQAEARIAHMAHHDSLTLLPNRVMFRTRVEEALRRRRADEWVVVFCLDLDHFKSVNDTLGHPIGDALLRVVAGRIGGCVREGATVARLSGDEFAIVLSDLDSPEAAGELAGRIIEAVADPYVVDGHHIIIGTSIGIALAPTDGSDPDMLLKNADMALYRAKADGRGTHRFFEPEMDARLQARRVLELDLRKALAAGEFVIHYQPLIELDGDRISGFEALLRWQHPVRGMLPPSDFVPLAEETGLIVPLGEWVLRRACAEAASWPGAIKIAVNLSPAQFKNRNLVAGVVGALAASGLHPSRLELEITESVLLQDNQQTLATLYQLRSLGVRISMDDFGTGYSSLSYLRSFPFDKIKIDKSFTRDLDEKEDSAAIIRAVAGLGHSLGMATTAEGVETARQLELLRAEGCTEVQGYLFGKPRPAREVAEMLHRFERQEKVA